MVTGLLVSKFHSVISTEATTGDSLTNDDCCAAVPCVVKELPTAVALSPAKAKAATANVQYFFFIIKRLSVYNNFS